MPGDLVPLDITLINFSYSEWHGFNSWALN